MLKVYDYFSDAVVQDNGKKTRNGYNIAQFRKDWAALSAESKAQLIAGVEDGTLNY
jgi:hypothetical protein